MKLRIKLLAERFEDFHPEAFEHLAELLQGHLHPFEQPLVLVAIFAGMLDRPLEVVDDRNHFAQQVAVGKADRIFLFALRPLAVIFQVGQGAQVQLLVAGRLGLEVLPRILCSAIRGSIHSCLVFRIVFRCRGSFFRFRRQLLFFLFSHLVISPCRTLFPVSGSPAWPYNRRSE